MAGSASNDPIPVGTYRGVNPLDLSQRGVVEWALLKRSGVIPKTLVGSRPNDRSVESRVKHREAQGKLGPVSRRCKADGTKPSEQLGLRRVIGSVRVTPRRGAERTFCESQSLRGVQVVPATAIEQIERALISVEATGFDRGPKCRAISRIANMHELSGAASPFKRSDHIFALPNLRTARMQEHVFEAVGTQAAECVVHPAAHRLRRPIGVPLYAVADLGAETNILARSFSKPASDPLLGPTVGARGVDRVDPELDRDRQQTPRFVAIELAQSSRPEDQWLR